jgi:phosphoribosylformylglycinamidine synthase
MSTAEVPLEKSLSSIEGTTRRWIYQQYDQRVGAKTVRDCEDSISVVRLPSSGRGLGLVLGCRPHVMRLDARVGGYDAAFYPALELAAKGFKPLALTDCLNFGNPEKVEIMSEFVASVDALADAAKILDAPVISGNVSFYNETLNQNITSTPSTGRVGLRESIESIPRSQFVNEGDEVLLWRLNGVTLQGDQLDRKGALMGDINPKTVAAWIKDVEKMALSPQVAATRVVGKFGLGYALFRMCDGELGIETNGSEDWKTSGGAPWSDERLYEVIFVGAKGLKSELEKTSANSGAKVYTLGNVRRGVFKLEGAAQDLKNLNAAYESGWRKNFENLA